MPTPIDLAQLKRAAAEVFPRHGVQFAYLHGSQADGTATVRSDVDIAIMADALPPRERLQRELILELELSRALPRLSFDVRSLNGAPLAVRGRIVQTGQLVYSGDDSRRVDFEVLTRKLYFDFRPTLEAHQAAFIRRHLGVGHPDHASRP